MAGSTLVIGGDGLLGYDVIRRCWSRGTVVSPTEKELDIRNEQAVRTIIENLRPDLVINCAAIVDVARCERDPELAHAVHVMGAAAVARAAESVGAAHVLVSTDYVFSSHPKGGMWCESDPTGPLNVYGHTKLEGEYRVLAECPDSLVARVGILFGHGRKSAIWKMAEAFIAGDFVDVYHDVHGSPTDTDECARHLMAAVDAGLSGVIHAVGKGQASRYDLAVVVREWTGRRQAEIGRSLWRERSRVRCPMHAALKNDRLAQAGLDEFTHYTESIPVFLDELRAAGRLAGLRPCGGL